MQVSWIDPEEVRDLLRQIEGPQKAARVSAWEVHTLPAAPLAKQAAEPLVSEDTTAPAASLAEHPLNEVRTGPANAELWRIRERLRALREKAQNAGIFSRATASDAPASTPEMPTEADDSEPPASHGPAEAVAEEAPTAAPDTPKPTIEESPAAPTGPAEDAAPAGVPEESQQVPIFTEASAPPAYEPLFSTSEPLPPQAVEEEAPPALAQREAANEPALIEPLAAPESVTVPFVVSALGLSERLNGVATWVCARLGTHEVLLVDDYGDVLWGAQGQTALVLSAMMAWHSAQRASAACIDPQRIDKPLGPDRALTVLPMRTRYGVVSLAVIQGQPVSEVDAAAIREALALAVEGPNEAPGHEGT